MYDVVVIGSGPGGYVAAIRASQLGLKTACIEKDPTLGGTCLNVGCIPSKALLYSSEFYTKLEHESASHGIQATASFDFSQMMARKENVVKSFTQGIEYLFKKNKIERLSGHATLKAPHLIEVNGQTIEAKHIILATGSTPTPLPFLPFDEKRVLSSTGALALKEVPKKLLIIGAGIIGVELGSVYSRLGASVEFIEFSDRICSTFDSALSKALQKSLSSQGMTFHLSHKVTKASVSEEVVLTAEGKEMRGDAVLIAVGRRPYTENLGLEALSIRKDARGFIEVDDAFRTAQPHIFAIGDLIDGPMLAHKASEEGIAVAELIAGHVVALDYAAIPSVAYTHPEVAAVGFTEEELKKRNVAYKAAQFPFKANSRARCIGDDEGFVKMLADAATRRLLGVHIFGPSASELIGEATLAIQQRLTADELASLCHAHPTLSESLKEAAASLFDRPIHL